MCSSIHAKMKISLRLALLVAVISSCSNTAQANDAVNACAAFTNFDDCVFADLDTQCKMVLDGDTCKCVPVGGSKSHLENCVGDSGKKSSSDSNQNEVVVAVLVGLTILVCVTCVCLVFLQPFSTSTKMSVETQPLLFSNPFASSPSAPMQPVYTTPASNYQPLQATATQAGEPSYYFQQPPPAQPAVPPPGVVYPQQ